MNIPDFLLKAVVRQKVPASGGSTAKMDDGIPAGKNDVAAGTDATDKPRLEAEGTGKRYQGSPLERRTQN